MEFLLDLSSAGVLKDALSLLLIFSPLTFIDVFVGVDHLASTMSLVKDIVTFILIAIRVEYFNACV